MPDSRRRVPGGAGKTAWIGGLFLCLCAAACWAGAEAAGPVPEQTGLVVDQVAGLNEAAHDALEARLQGIQDSGRAQVAVLISGGTHGEPLADYALRVAETWQLGRAGRDDGLLLLLIPSGPAARIEVGYGLEGDITDLRAGRWVDELLPAVREGQLAEGLNRLVDEIEAALPAAAVKADADEENYLFPDHPEWRMPFVLAVFSPFALFPLFFHGRGALASAPLFAAFMACAAGALWESRTAAIAAAGVALPLPLMWSLNWYENDRLAVWLRYAKAFGNLVAVAAFFAVITLFVGVGLSASGTEEVWAAPIFAGLLALGLAVFLFPGKPARVLQVVLRSACHFVFVLTLAYVTLGPFIPHPARMAFAAAGLCTAFAALGLYLESRERLSASSAAGIRWSAWFFGLALLVAVPFALVALVLAASGQDSISRLTHAVVGGGSLVGTLWWAARIGLFAVVRIGLGGRFGGGGASGG